jgi:hypothetical protein
MGTNRNAYIHQIGSHVIKQIDCWDEVMNGDYDDDTHTYHRYDLGSPTFPQIFWREYGYKVKGVVGKMGSSARGRILACGVAKSGNGMVAYHEVTDNQCDTKMGGDELLTHLASLVVTAAIVDIFRQRVRNMDSEACEREDARQRHLEQGTPSELVEWFQRNPLPGD